MRLASLLLITFLLVGNLAVAQDEGYVDNICKAGKACAKACRMKAVNDEAEKDPAYQKQLVKCTEEIGKKLKLIE